jgi:ribosomal protein S18 acetylase RimI-like enzyme
MLEQIRSFNRTVTRRLGVLNDRYLGRDRPLVESRLLFEIGLQGAPVSELRATLGLDSGFLSRLLRSLERKGLTTTGKHRGGDGRARFARLTRAGRAELRRINALSDDLARSMLAPLTESQGSRLVAAMSEVERLLRASSVELKSADPQGPDAQHCLAQYFGELTSRFKGGFDRKADGAAAVADFVPPTGCLLIAHLYGKPVGCGALRTFDRGLGEIKRLWISPNARGLGLGRRLLEELERTAREHMMHAVRLDTNESLHEAIRLYRTSGYHEIERFNDNPYAHHWFEKTLTS